MLSILIAFVLDLIFKDPPNAVHPTAWMGRVIYLLWGRKTPENRTLAFIKGMIIPIATAALFGTAAYLIPATCRYYQLPGIVTSIIVGFLLYLTITFTRLLEIGEIILSELEAHDLDGARRSLSYHLVSRDTSRLDESEVCAATLESLSENLTDGFTAPLIFFMIFGLPGAVIYRVFNTCDAMLGYRDEQREWLGKFSARVDDIFNLIPARITGHFILLAGIIQVGINKGPKVLFRNHRKTESPNAGWTMSAIAGVLDVRLEKVGCYILNPEGAFPRPIHLLKGISVCRKSGFLFFVCLFILMQGLGYGISM